MKHRAIDTNQVYMIDGSNEATDNHETFANAKFANELVSDDGGAIIVYICHIHTQSQVTKSFLYTVNKPYPNFVKMTF